MITKELFDRYLRNDCSAQERKLVNDYLQEHPEKLDEFMPETEVEEPDAFRLHPAVTDRMWQKVQKGKTPVRKRMIIWGSIAAAISLLLITGRSWVQHTPPALNKDIITVKHQTPSWQQRFNSAKGVLALSLPDASVVELQPNSGIRYLEPFDGKIYLTGQGLFRVAKNEQRPFMVYSGGIYTTVLGTSFNVSAFDSSSTIRVRLYTGKVAVTAANQRFTLQPGQELTYYKEGGNVDLITLPSRKHTAADTRPDWYLFSGQSLSQVFDQLSEYYHVEIDYKPADLQNMYFAAKFDKNDALDKIMEDIALLNNLTILHKEGKYTVLKSN